MIKLIIIQIRINHIKNLKIKYNIPRSKIMANMFPKISP